MDKENKTVTLTVIDTNGAEHIRIVTTEEFNTIIGGS